jgi:hypothetical protein
MITHDLVAAHVTDICVASRDPALQLKPCPKPSERATFVDAAIVKKTGGMFLRPEAHMFN